MVQHEVIVKDKVKVVMIAEHFVTGVRELALFSNSMQVFRSIASVFFMIFLQAAIFSEVMQFIMLFLLGRILSWQFAEK